MTQVIVASVYFAHGKSALTLLLLTAHVYASVSTKATAVASQITPPAATIITDAGSLFTEAHAPNPNTNAPMLPSV